MNKLKQANLYRSELIPVSGKLVERYNQCLKKLGFAPTQLTSFSIDGIGYSPEIAEEKGTTMYLNNGEANPHAIIISPLQKGKPVYSPFHSFDKDMMRQVFNVHGQKINDITRDSAICIDFDQSIDVYYEPLEVLRYDKVIIKFHLINNLDQIQKEQQQLIDTFKQGNNFIDEDLHAKLLKSAKTYGDLRGRDLKLHSLQYQSSSFFTKCFGGVYVLRDFILPIIVFEDLKWYKEAIKDTTHDVLIFHINQPELMAKLYSHDVITYDLEKAVNSKAYQRIKKRAFAMALKETQHPIKAILTDSVLFKSYLNKLDITTRKQIMGVELYLEKIEKSNQFKIVDVIDKNMFNALHTPHSSLIAEHQDLIWKLLINIAPCDVLFLYWYDKTEFYKQYSTWDDSFKDWVIDTISNNF